MLPLHKILIGHEQRDPNVDETSKAHGSRADALTRLIHPGIPPHPGPEYNVKSSIMTKPRRRSRWHDVGMPIGVVHKQRAGSTDTAS